jgi:hypothetical protein
MRHVGHASNTWFYVNAYEAAATDSGGRALTTLRVSRLTVMTWPRRRTMYSGSSGRLAFSSSLCMAVFYTRGAADCNAANQADD